jgi:uncharacterized protein (TIGR03086 family)
MDNLTAAEAAGSVLRNTMQNFNNEHLTRPTPCRNYDVTTLAEHLIDTLTRMSVAAGIELPPAAETALPERVAQTAQEVLLGWCRRGTGGQVVFAGRSLPAEDLIGIIALELLVHAWDLATAMGIDLTVPDDLADAVLRSARRTLTPESRRVAGFDPPMIGARASVLDELVAFTGRDPVGYVRST